MADGTLQPVSLTEDKLPWQLSLRMLFQESLSFDGSHAACSRSCHGLTVTAIDDIPAGENAGNTGEDII
jgi:hypothetical protein